MSNPTEKNTVHADKATFKQPLRNALHAKTLRSVDRYELVAEGNFVHVSRPGEGPIASAPLSNVTAIVPSHADRGADNPGRPVTRAGLTTMISHPGDSSQCRTLLADKDTTLWVTDTWLVARHSSGREVWVSVSGAVADVELAAEGSK